MKKFTLDLEPSLIGSADVSVGDLFEELNCYSGDTLLQSLVDQGLDAESALSVIVEMASKGDLIVVWNVIREDMQLVHDVSDAVH